VNVNDVYKLVQFITNKQQKGDVSPERFNLVINQAQLSFLDFLLGEFQQYQYGRPVAKVEFGQNQTVRQRLSPVIYGYNLSIDSTGFSPYPSDFQQVDAIWSFYGYQRVRFVQQDYLYSYYNSKIDPIATNPIYLIEDVGFRFYPSNYGAAKLSYVRTPSQIVWGYTLDGNSRPVYDAATSVNPVWQDVDMLEIISRALQMIGVNLQSAQITQYANMITKTGQ
jgi:hypothetical protein